MLAHDLVVGHLDDRGDGCQSLDVGFLVHLAVGLVLDVGIEHGVVLQIPVGHHLVHVGIKTLGEDDVVIGDGVLQR